MLIRQETPADVDRIHAIHVAAFPSPGEGQEPVEAQLVRDLRADAGWVPALSLVAEGPDGTVVGHVVCTIGSISGSIEGSVEGSVEGPVVGLGPIGVDPDGQGAGVGSALMHAAVAAADALGYAAVVLLGSTEWYPRFGFVPAAQVGVTPTEPAWGDHFQLRTLAAWSPAMTGTFRYAAPFDAL